jgi:hypothetical protein
MKKISFFLALFFAVIVTFDAFADVQIRNKDDDYYNLNLNCDGLDRGISIDPHTTIAFSLGMTDSVGFECVLTVNKTYNTIEINDNSVYVIKNGDLFEK